MALGKTQNGTKSYTAMKFWIKLLQLSNLHVYIFSTLFRVQPNVMYIPNSKLLQKCSYRNKAVKPISCDV